MVAIYLLLISNLIILPFLCFNKTSLLEYSIGIGVDLVMYKIWFSSSMATLLSTGYYPSISLSNTSPDLVAISNLINP